MESWFIPVISATFIYGAINFLYKVVAERNLNADRVVNAVGASVAVLSLLTLAAAQGGKTPAVFTRGVFTYAFFNGLFFGLGALTKFAALKHAPAGTVFPLNRLNNVMVMLVGFLFFHDRPSMMQTAGLALTIGVIALVSLDRPDDSGRPFPRKKRGMIFAMLSASCTAASMTVGKLLADTGENRLAYICCSYFLVFLITTALSAVKGHDLSPRAHPNWKSTLAFGVMIGSLNYAGYFLVLKGFGLGPISLVQAILSMSMVIPIALSYLFYRERLSPANKIAIALAVISAVLISGK
ncbi:MAG: DMT family transporter [Kiritimatiellia bacterium]